MITGSWTATAGLFLAAPWGTMGDCATGSMPVVPWLERASGYVATPGGFDLVDASGHALAVLTIDGAPDPIATAAEFYAQAPQITPETTKAFRTPSALATGLTAATAEALLGHLGSRRLRGENQSPRHLHRGRAVDGLRRL